MTGQQLMAQYLDDPTAADPSCRGKVKVEAVAGDGFVRQTVSDTASAGGLIRLCSEFGLTIVQRDEFRHFTQNPGASLHRIAELTFQTDRSMGAMVVRLMTHQLMYGCALSSLRSPAVPNVGRSRRSSLASSNLIPELLPVGTA